MLWETWRVISGAEKLIIFSVSHRMILSCWDEKKPSWVSLYVKIQGLEYSDILFSLLICITPPEWEHSWVQGENFPLLVSEWALREQIGINAKRFVLLGLAWSQEQSMMDWKLCWWAGWELWGGAMGAQGVSWFLVLCQRGKGSVLRILQYPLLSLLLSFSLSQQKH